MDTQPTILSQEQINNLPLFEFFNYCKDNPQIDELTIYNYIKHVTNDFNKQAVKFFQKSYLRYITNEYSFYAKNNPEFTIDISLFSDFTTQTLWDFYNIKYLDKWEDTAEFYVNALYYTIDLRRYFSKVIAHKYLGGTLLDIWHIADGDKQYSISDYIDELGKSCLGLPREEPTSYFDLPEKSRQVVDKLRFFFTHHIMEYMKDIEWVVKLETTAPDENGFTIPLYVFEEREKFNTSKIEENREQKNKKQKKTTPSLSEKLDTPKFRRVLKKAIDKGLIETNDDRYVWKGTKALFGYFVQKMNDYLKLKHGEKQDLKSFSETFNISTNKISSAIQDYKKGNKEKPLKFEKVDSLMI